MKYAFRLVHVLVNQDPTSVYPARYEGLEPLEDATDQGWQVVGVVRTFSMRESHYATVLMQRPYSLGDTLQREAVE